LEAANAIIKGFQKASNSQLNEFQQTLQTALKNLRNIVYLNRIQKPFLCLQSAEEVLGMTALAAFGKINRNSYWNSI
jgi:hypothetical protein